MSSYKWIIVWPVWSSVTQFSLTRPGFPFLFVTSFGLSISHSDRSFTIQSLICGSQVELTEWDFNSIIPYGRLELLGESVDGFVLSKRISPELALTIVEWLLMIFTINAIYFGKSRTWSLEVKSKIFICWFYLLSWWQFMNITRISI